MGGVPKEEGGRLHTSQSKAPGMEWLQRFPRVPLTSHVLPQGTAGPGLEKKLSGALGRWAQGPEETQVLVAPEAGRRWLWP